MAAKTKRCKIHYRRLRRDGANLPSKSLSQLLAESLYATVEGVALKDKVDLRIASSADDAAQRVLNDVHIGEGFVFGNTCSFSPGQMQALLRTVTNDGSHGSLEEALEAYGIQESRPIEGHEYIGGICYWLAIDDHFYQIQHSSLQAKQMEEYFNWLLKERTSILSSTGFVELVCKFDRDVVGDNFDDISAIEIGGIAPETVFQPVTASKDGAGVRDVDVVEEVGRQSAYFEKAKKVLEALVGAVGAEKIISEIPDEAALEVKVNIGYKATKRKFDREFMGNIASGLRNMPDGEVTVRGKFGEAKGSDVRLSEVMSVKKISDQSSLLDLEHTLEQMLEVHRRFVHDGKVG